MPSRDTLSNGKSGLSAYYNEFSEVVNRLFQLIGLGNILPPLAEQIIVITIITMPIWLVFILVIIGDLDDQIIDEKKRVKKEKMDKQIRRNMKVQAKND